MLWAAAVRRASSRAALRPVRLRDLRFRLCLSRLKTGSIIHFRGLYLALPRLVRILRSISCNTVAFLGIGPTVFNCVMLAPLADTNSSVFG